MSLANQQIVGSALERPSDAILGIGYSLLVTAEDTGGAYELMKFSVPNGLGPPPHIHHREDEHFFVLEGEFEVTIGSQTHMAKSGTFLHLPKHVPHGLRATNAELCSFLCWVIPGNLGRFFNSFKKPWPKDSKYPPLLTENDIQDLVRVSKDFDIELLPPE